MENDIKLLFVHYHGYIYLQDQIGKMRTCCTSNASSVQDPDSSNKIGGGEVGVSKK